MALRAAHVLSYPYKYAVFHANNASYVDTWILVNSTARSNAKLGEIQAEHQAKFGRRCCSMPKALFSPPSSIRRKCR